MLVRKNNRTLQINEAQKDMYLKKGYSVIKEDGTVVEYASSSEKEELIATKNKVVELEAKIAEMETAEPTSAKKQKEEIATLKETIKNLTEEIRVLTEATAAIPAE